MQLLLNTMRRRFLSANKEIINGNAATCRPINHLGIS